ncbi:MAG: UDP-N-acetylmuramate--L-alanine ligase, partial [bacterium]|nr:UDP-N-acetylmuramate--L-alanine ligase [bacterium]
MFRNTRHVHLVAIGGIGMSGIAEILLNLGFRVSGSDLRASEATERLERLGATIAIGHREGQVRGADVLVYSSAVTRVNPEVTEARRLGIPVIRRAEMLAELMRLKYGIAVAGSHGKTTTTSLVAEVLAAGGLDPTVLVGGRALATGANAVLGAGDYLVAEADESDGTFLHLVPTVAVVTNIDHEHVDFYPEMDDLRAAFRAFLARVPFYGACVLCQDDPEVRALIPHLERKVITYGLGADADVRGVPEPSLPGAATVLAGGRELGRLELRLRGRHNLTNALAAVAVGMELGVPFAQAARALGGFAGVGRRYQEHGEPGGVRVVDDYGHHPTEIAATLAVARDEGRRVVVLFQPHRYSRTLRFAGEFADALAAADVVGLLPVYAASEEPLPGADSGLIATALARKGRDAVSLLAGADDVERWLDATVIPGDLLVTLGAGDIGRLVEPICGHLAR